MAPSTSSRKRPKIFKSRRFRAKQAEVLSTDVDEITTDIDKIRFKTKKRSKRTERAERKRQKRMLAELRRRDDADASRNVSSTAPESTSDCMATNTSQDESKPSNVTSRRQRGVRRHYLCKIDKTLLKLSLSDCSPSDALERRAAKQREKRRLKRIMQRTRSMICFRCRQAGHSVSSCPLLCGDEGGPICYKCGSPDHTIKKCPAKTAELNYALCFVCNSVGHLAGQCPLRQGPTDSATVLNANENQRHSPPLSMEEGTKNDFLVRTMSPCVNGDEDLDLDSLDGAGHNTATSTVLSNAPKVIRF